MILDNEITFNVSNKNKGYLSNRGYDVSNKTVLIKTLDLPPSSHMIIRVKCDVCGKEKELCFLKYNLNTKFNTIIYSCSQKCSGQKIIDTFNEKYGCISSQHPDIKLKQAETNIKLYGGKSPHCNKDVKDKYYKTMISKYGVKYPCHNEEIKQKMFLNVEISVEKANQTKIERGLMVDYGIFMSFRKYKKIVKSETRKFKKKLFEDWNGYDFYDNTFIGENFKLIYYDVLYPTIDHKKSVLYGFLNDVDPYEIGNIDNLCITTRSNNSIKNSKCYFPFSLKLDL